ncbi:hypothetical protein [Burkholderia vietnamiensis]|uniref:hypothetical protein n=1 Tax=Burkholderia vietnamiensis TaxID=60552 RepID=UPI001CF208D6|nr:hypothetical protein [Burkholderia vietnamiensis]MCA8448977.1 hypothetical protein [Burkholderia vietnamiensis]
MIARTQNTGTTEDDLTMKTMTCNAGDVFVKRDGNRFRLIRSTEITLPQAVAILGVPSSDAMRYLRAMGIRPQTALPDRLRVSQPERVYVRTEVEGVAPGVNDYFVAKAADEKKRHDDSLLASRVAAAAVRIKQAEIAAAYPDIGFPYVSRRTAAYLTNRDLNDPLFDDEARLESIEDETGERIYAQDDLKVHRNDGATSDVLDMRMTLERFTRRATEARHWQAVQGALCAA